MRLIAPLFACMLITVLGCNRDDDASTANPKSASTRPAEPAKVRLTLDWKPEPEFGGFYAAELNGSFKKHGLDVEIRPFGPGAPTWQLVATGRTDFATTAADQVLIARSQGA